MKKSSRCSGYALFSRKTLRPYASCPCGLDPQTHTVMGLTGWDAGSSPAGHRGKPDHVHPSRNTLRPYACVIAGLTRKLILSLGREYEAYGVGEKSQTGRDATCYVEYTIAKSSCMEYERN